MKHNTPIQEPTSVVWASSIFAAINVLVLVLISCIVSGLKNVAPHPERQAHPFVTWLFETPTIMMDSWFALAILFVILKEKTKPRSMSLLINGLVLVISLAGLVALLSLYAYPFVM
jgi:hypothetical protein